MTSSTSQAVTGMSIPPSSLPNRKITSVTLAGSVSAIFLWARAPILPPVPPEVASALTTLIAAIIGYIVPEAK